MTPRLAKRIVTAMWNDLDESDQIVAMPRSLFNFIANEMGVAMPDTPIDIIVTPPRFKL